MPRRTQAGADHRAVQLRDHREGQRADCAADLMNTGNELSSCLRIQGFQFIRVRPSAEVPAAAGDHGDAQRFCVERFERARQRRQHGGIQSICFFRPVEEDTGDRIFEFDIHHAFIL
jgi:hypothetical protein